MFELMKLPFKESILAPYISVETVAFHYGKHHKAYVDKVNELISGTEFQELALEEIIEKTFDKPEYQTLYNNAGQVFNHNVYWNSVGIGERLAACDLHRIISAFGTAEALKTKLVDEAVKFFGSGWVWLVEDSAGGFKVLTTKNGDTPLVLGFKPVFNIDIWEHAYYLDYQNRKKEYVQAFAEHILKI